MAEDRQEQKQTKDDAEEEATAESALTTEPTLSEDEPELSANVAVHDPTEVICPGHIILKALQQVVSESKKPLYRVTDLKSKCSKSKKTCKKKPMKRLVGPEERACLHAENENSIPEPTTDPLFNPASALEYVEKTCSTITAGSRLQSSIEENLEYEDLYSMDEMDEVEFVAEIRLGDVEAYSSTWPGNFRRDRRWRIQKSVCLSTSGQQLSERQSAIKETASRFSRTENSLEHLKCPLNKKPYMPRTLHRTGVSTKCDQIPKSKGVHCKDLDRTLQQKSPSTAAVVPGLLWPDKSPLDAFSISRVQNKLCSNRTSLINSNTQFIRDHSDALVSLGLALGNGTGVSGGQQRPLGGEGSTSNNQHSQPAGSLEKTDTSSSYSSSSSQNPAHSAGGSGTQSNMSQDLDIYDPFHPTDEENVNGDYIYDDSPEKEMDEQEDQKYDPFDPTGSNPSSSERSPSPYEDDDDDDDDIGSESHPEGRISEALAGIYDDNSLSPEYPGLDKNKESSKPAEYDKFQGIDEHEGSPEVDSLKLEQRLSKDSSESASKNVSKLDFEPYSPSSSIDLDTTDDVEVQEASPKVSEETNVNEPPAADSTLNESNQSDASVEPIRRVFTVDVGKDFSHKSEFSSEAESKSKVEIKVSLESLAKPDMKSYLRLEKIAKLGSESRSRHKRRHSSERRDRDDDSDRKYDSEIEEGEIVQPDEDCFSPMPLFRSRCRVMERPLRMVEGDDFLSLHADSDEEGALQIDFGENQMDNRWKGLDLRRKITNQRRERYRKKSGSPTRTKKQSKSRSPSSSRSRKKNKRDRKRSRERKRSKEPRTSTSWSNTKKLGKDGKDRKRSRSRSYNKDNKVSRSRSRDRRRSRSWSPSISTSLSAVGSSRTSAERRKGRRSKSKEKSHRWSYSGSTDRSRKDKHKEKHRSEVKKKKKRSRSKSRERDRDRRSSRHSNEQKEKDKPRSRHSLDEPKVENPPLLERRRRDSRSVVPPSIQDLNNADLFTIKRTITVNPEEKLDREELLRSPELSGKREVLYDSEGLSFETYSDRETLDDRDGKLNRPFDRHSGKSDSGKRRLPMEYDTKRGEGDRESRQKISKERDRKRDRSYTEDSRERYKKRFKEVPEPEPEPLKLDREKIRAEKDKTPKKIKTSHKDGKGSSTRKVKLQSKVAVLIREGVSSTTSVKEAGSIGVKFSRDRESRSPFLKSEDKIADIKSSRPKPETDDIKEPLLRPKKIKGLKTKTGVKKVKTTGAGGALVKTKGTLEKKKKKLKTKASLKKSKADSCSQEILSPIEAKEEPIWSDTEKTEIKLKPPSPPKPANEQELTPDSQTVDSSCKTPDVSFMPEELPPDPERSTDLEVDSISEPKEEAPRPPPPPPPPPAPMSWNLQSGVDCATSGVLALTALLFKMEEANMASRAKAQELIQATNQILSQSKPSTSLVNQPPAPPVLSSMGHSAPPYLLGGLPLSRSSSPPTPTGITCLNTQAMSGSTSSSFFNTTSLSDLGKREGSTSSEGRGDTDKYLKKLHTQERAVEEVKLAIKPYYQRKEITKEDYKDILRKAVHKICHSKSGEINPVKVNNLVKAYVQRYKYFRKHGKKMDDDESSYRSGKDQGGLDKTLPPLPLI